MLVLSELWYPQGGGAELATYLYTKMMICAGHKVTIASNQIASLEEFSESCRIIRLPFDKLRSGKVSLIYLSRSIRKKILKDASSTDVIYIPGKMIFLSSWLRSINRSARIIVHLHDYQYICPHGSLVNMLHHRTCDFIWSNIDCSLCTQRFMRAEGSNIVGSLLGSATTTFWKHLAKPDEILDSVDNFIAVSNAEFSLVKNNLGRYGDKFETVCNILYNPIQSGIDYVPPKFDDKICLGFFGGDRFIKGYSEMMNFFNQLTELAPKLITSRFSSPVLDARIESYGNLDVNGMTKVFERVWITLFTSIMEETSSYIVVESQLRGRPVIATSVGGVPENIVKSGFTGTTLKVEEYHRFRDLVLTYSGLLSENPAKFTHEISMGSKEFFEKRSVSSYDKFLKLIEQ